MHMWVIYVGRHLSRTLKKSPCPGRGSNRGPFELKSIAIKAGLYRKAVQVYIIPNVYPVTYIFLNSPISSDKL